MFTQLLEQIALGLEQRQIAYMIIGGQAVLIYGEPRLTRDIDVTLGVGPERVTDLVAFARASAWRSSPAGGGSNPQCGITPGRWRKKGA
jgi:hypothetical protein